MPSRTLEEIARLAGGRLVGDGAIEVTGVGTLAGAGPGQIAFLANRQYRPQLRATAASAVLLAEDDRGDCPTNAIVVADPYLAYARVAGLFTADEPPAAGVHPAATVDPEARVAEDVSIAAGCVIGAGAVVESGCRIGPGCIIEDGVRLGPDCHLIARVTLHRGSLVGARARLLAGAVIGSDGFGFANDQGRWVRVPQLGGVRLGDDVEVGANTTIDRGAIEDTVIEDGVKLDNQIQVAHNVHIGADTAIAGCVGIAGSTTIGRQCAIGGGVGIVGHLEITDRVIITAMSLVSQSIKEPGVYSSGTPLERNDRWHRNWVRHKQLDDMARRLKALEREFDARKND